VRETKRAESREQRAESREQRAERQRQRQRETERAMRSLRTHVLLCVLCICFCMHAVQVRGWKIAGVGGVGRVLRKGVAVAALSSALLSCSPIPISPTSPTPIPTSISMSPMSLMFVSPARADTTDTIAIDASVEQQVCNYVPMYLCN
jgi:hypothetical protein